MAQLRTHTTRRADEQAAPKPIRAPERAYAVSVERFPDFVKVLDELSRSGSSARSEVLHVIVKSFGSVVRRKLNKAVREKIATPVMVERRPVGKRGTTSHAGIDPVAFEPGPKARALLRGLEIAERDLKAAGGAYDLAQVEQLLSISRQAIHKKVQEGALLAVPGPGNQRRYPAVQFTQGGTLPGLREALTALGSRNGWYKLNWLVNPDPRIGNRAPAELLQAGDVATAVAAARSQGEQGG